MTLISGCIESFLDKVTQNCFSYAADDSHLTLKMMRIMKPLLLWFWLLLLLLIDIDMAVAVFDVETLVVAVVFPTHILN